MAIDPSKRPKGTKEANKQEKNFELRRVLGQAIGFVEGQEAVRSFQTLTVADLLQQQIDRVEKGAQGRSSVLARISKVEQDVLSVIKSIQATPEDEKIPPNPVLDVNTPATPPTDEEMARFSSEESNDEEDLQTA